MNADEITLETLFALAATTGLLSAQMDDPDPEWIADWAIAYGRLAARKARKGQRKRKEKDVATT